MRHLLQRHPLAIEARLDDCLALTYAVPAQCLASLVPPGLSLETWGPEDRWGLVAVALVQTRGLRPAGCPRWLGRDFALVGYRVFVRLEADGRPRRGLRILRSDTDRPLMVAAGNLLTHYDYRRAEIQFEQGAEELAVRVRTPGGLADLDLVARLSGSDVSLPESTCFASEREARRFAGPMPWTFDYEPETESVVAIRATRGLWRPRLVEVDVERCAFLEQAPFADGPVRLASAFYVAGINYRWERGIRIPLEGEQQ